MVSAAPDLAAPADGFHGRSATVLVAAPLRSATSVLLSRRLAPRAAPTTHAGALDVHGVADTIRAGSATDSASRRATADSTQGAIDGARDAREPGTLGRGALAFAATVAVPAGAGLFLVGPVARAGSTAPPAALARTAADRGPAYADGYQRAFAQRLQLRRRRAARRGAVAGVITVITVAGYSLYALGHVRGLK